MRTVPPEGQALLDRIAAGETIPWVTLIELQLSETLRFVTAGQGVTWNGFEWSPSGAGTIEPIEDSTTDLLGVRFTMPGIDSSQIALALGEPVEGRPARIYDALVDPDTGTVAYAECVWAGELSVPEFSDGKTAVVTVTGEHVGMRAIRAKPRRYTDDDQQRRYPGDTCFDYDASTDAAPVVWPAASFFRQ